MIRKNDTLIFLKAYDVFFQNQVSFCFYQKKNTKLQMSLHYIYIYSIWYIKSVLHYTIYMHNTNCPIVRSIVLYRLVIRENEWRVETNEKWRVEFKCQNGAL